MKSLETKEAKGFRFVVADDLRNAPTLKSEAQRKNIFTILRHFQRIKEIRGPGQILRYAILWLESIFDYENDGRKLLPEQ